MHGHSCKPQVTETVQLAEFAELSGISRTEGSIWNCVRPLQALCAGSIPGDLSSHWWWWCILYSRCSWEGPVLALTWGHFLPSHGTAGCVLELGYDRMNHQMAADWHWFLRPTFLNSLLLPLQVTLSVVQTGLSIVRQCFNIKGFIWNGVFYRKKNKVRSTRSQTADMQRTNQTHYKSSKSFWRVKKVSLLRQQASKNNSGRTSGKIPLQREVDLVKENWQVRKKVTKKTKVEVPVLAQNILVHHIHSLPHCWQKLWQR